MEKDYLSLLQYVLENGEKKQDRTGTGTISSFGHMIRFDLEKGFPLLTTKKMHTKSIIHELLWFIRGETNIAYLKENGVRIWDEWADSNGNLGPIYGKQWRHWSINALHGKDSIISTNAELYEKLKSESAAGKVSSPFCFDDEKKEVFIDQLKNVVERIKTNPSCRRLIVSAWNPSEISYMGLPPCHALFQFNVSNGRLSCLLYQRSADLFLGVPFNIASYALLTAMVAQVCGLKPGHFIHQIGDAHIYLDHVAMVRTQLSREPHLFPRLVLNPEIKSIFDFRFEDISIVDYTSHPAIKAKVSV